MLRVLAKVGIMKALGMTAAIVNAGFLVAYLKPEEVGVCFLLVSLARITAILFSLGLANAVIPRIEARKAAGGEPEIIALASLLLGAVLALGASSIALLAPLPLTAALGDTPNIRLYLSCLVAMTLFELIFVQYYRTRDAFVLAALFQNSQGRNILFAVGMSLLLLMQLPSALRLQSVLLVISICAGLPVLVGLAFTQPPLRRLRSALGEIAPLLRTGIGFLPSLLISQGMPHILIIIVGWLGEAVAAAVFGLAQRIAGIAGIVNQVTRITFVRAIRLYLAGDTAATRDELTRYALLATAGTVAAALGYAIVGQQMINQFVDIKGYPGLHSVVAILLTQQILVSALGFSSMFLWNLGLSRYINRATMVSGSCALLVALGLTPVFGTSGTALGMLTHALIFHGMTTRYLMYRENLPDFSYRHLRNIAGQLGTYLLKKIR